MKMEAEVRVMLPQAQEHQGLPEANSGKAESPRPLGFQYFVRAAWANEYNCL